MIKRPALFFPYAVFAWNKSTRKWDHYGYISWQGKDAPLLYDSVRSILSGPAVGYVAIENQHAVREPRFEYWTGKNRQIEPYAPK